MRGIILAGGSGTRLYPITLGVSEAAATRLRQTDDLLSAVHADDGRHPRHSGDHHRPTTRRHSSELLGDGTAFGINISYAVQDRPEGLAQAFVIGADYIGSRFGRASSLGDNIFHGTGFRYATSGASNRSLAASYSPIGWPTPRRMVSSDSAQTAVALSIEEKPASPNPATPYRDCTSTTTT